MFLYQHKERSKSILNHNGYINFYVVLNGSNLDISYPHPIIEDTS